MINNILSKIKLKTDLRKLFSLNMNYNYSNCERILLDEIWMNVNDSSFFKCETILNLIDERLQQKNKDIYICLLIFSQHKTEREAFDDQEIKRLQDLGIDIPSKKMYFSNYDENDEWYCCRLFYKESFSKLENYIKGILGRSMKGEKYFESEVFIVDSTLSTVINLYDDRGMDVVTLG